MKNAIYIIIFIANSLILLNQEAVISEYYNDNDFNKEWTEILITKDFTSIVGYTIRDNSEDYNNGDKWQGGVKFNDIPLWKNLRSGTVIVIHHRGQSAIDVNPSDGYIEIGAENSTYFTKDKWGPISSLSLQKYGDVIQLRNASGANVHALAHVKRSSQGDFYQINGKKIAYVGDCDFGYSISVANADDIQDYNFNSSNLNGYDDNATVASHSRNHTKGKANNNSLGTAVNWKFWQYLREPRFDKPNLKADIINREVHLSWTAIDLNKSLNDYGGYVVLRTTDLTSNYCFPTDGKHYFVGQKLCSTSEVVAIIPGKEKNTFIDQSPLEGVETRYTIFGYNYDNGNKSSWNENDGRGIAYSNLVDKSSFINILIEPQIEVTIASREGYKFCVLDSTYLFTDIPEGEKSKYRYAWYLIRGGTESVIVDFKEPGVSDSIKVNKAGIYYLEIKDEDGNIVESNRIEIELIDKPEAYIADEDGNTFLNDTIIYLCDDDRDFTFRADLRELDPKESLYLTNGTDTISKNGTPIVVSSIGNYYYIFSIADCKDTSAKVTLALSEFDLVSNKAELNIILPLTVNSKTDNIILKNNSDEDLVIYQSDITLNLPFKVLNSFPVTIKSDSSLVLIIEFKPPISGSYSDNLIISGNCDEELSIPINGVQKATNANIISNLDTIDFGILAPCVDGRIDSVFTLINTGDEYIVLEKSFDHTEYFTEPPIINDTIFPGDSIDFIVFTNRNQKNEFNKLMKISWFSESGIRDTLEIYLKLFLIEPVYMIIEDSLDFGILSGCENSKIDSLHVYNNGLVDIVIEEKEFIDEVKLLNGPIIVPARDTVTIFLEFSSSSSIVINKINGFKIVPGCSLVNDKVLIKAKKVDDIYDIFLTDTLDFGTFYDCNAIDSTQYINVKITNNKVDDIVVSSMSSTNDFLLDNSLATVKDGNKIPVRFNKNSSGSYESKVEFIFEPCGVKREVILIAEVKSSIITITDTVKFDTYEQGNSDIKSIAITNSNEDDLIIGDLQLPNNITFVTQPNFPLVLKKDSTLFIDVELSTFTIGAYFDSVIVIQEEPCDISSLIYLTGNVTPSTVQPGNFIANIDVDRHIVAPKSTIDIPISINEDIYTFDNVLIDKIELNLNYAFRALDLRKVESLQSDIIVTHSDQEGNLQLILQKNNGGSFYLTQSNIINLQFFVLDAMPDTYRVDLTNGEVTAFPQMSIETDDSSFVEINENCVNTTNYIFTKPVKLVYYLDRGSLSISLKQPTDDSYKLEIYDITGRKIEQILDGTQSRGEHYQKIDLNDISTGIYFIVLQYPNNTITKQISIIK